VLLDLENYFCAYPEVCVSGGAGSQVRVHWQEALFEELWKIDKGNRDEIEGKCSLRRGVTRTAWAMFFCPMGAESSF
jgi:hypothetical protein